MSKLKGIQFNFDWGDPDYVKITPEMWEAVKPKIQNKNIGKVIILGTGGEINGIKRK